MVCPGQTLIRHSCQMICHPMPHLEKSFSQAPGRRCWAGLVELLRIEKQANWEGAESICLKSICVLQINFISYAVVLCICEVKGDMPRPKRCGSHVRDRISFRKRNGPPKLTMVVLWYKHVTTMMSMISNHIHGFHDMFPDSVCVFPCKSDNNKPLRWIDGL